LRLHRLINIYAEFPYQEDATLEQWRFLIYRNYDKTIKILVALSKDLHCLLCGNLSKNYNFESSLAEHYRFGHQKRPLADYTIENILNKTSDELGDSLY